MNCDKCAWYVRRELKEIEKDWLRQHPGHLIDTRFCTLGGYEAGYAAGITADIDGDDFVVMDEETARARLTDDEFLRLIGGAD